MITRLPAITWLPALLVLLLVPALPRHAAAAPIALDNDVSVEWGNVRCFPALNLFACPHDAVIVGGVRLVEAADLADFRIIIDFFTTDDEVEGFQLNLAVGDASLEQVLVGGIPLVLTTGDTFRFAGSTDIELGLGDFINVGLLPVGIDLSFSLSGVLFGNPSFGGCPDPGYIPDSDGDNIPDQVCPSGGAKSTELPAVITLVGGTEVVPEDVPEPATLALVLTGFGTLGVRRWRASRRAGARR